jgi:hypothetical protein
VFTSPATASVEENTTAVLTLAADDPEGSNVEFRLVEGADAELFQITGDDQLVFVAPPDFENPGDADGNNVYRVLVRADDDNVGGTSRQDFAITVTNVDEPPGGQPLGGVAALDFLF